METVNSSDSCIELGDMLGSYKFAEKVAHGVCLIYDVEIKMDVTVQPPHSQKGEI